MIRCLVDTLAVFGLVMLIGIFSLLAFILLKIVAVVIVVGFILWFILSVIYYGIKKNRKLG